jgi:NADH dehydrogenase
VYVGDVAEAFARALEDPKLYGHRLALCGPREYTLRQLVEYTAECLGLRRRIIPLPDFLSRIQAAIFDFVPGKPFSTDNYRSTLVDNVCGCNDLPSLGIAPTPVEAVVPGYLGDRRYRSRLRQYRSQRHHGVG